MPYKKNAAPARGAFPKQGRHNERDDGDQIEADGDSE
jgi:hypothetical protein